MGKTHIVLPDPHSCPEWNQERFKWFGKLVADVKPDTVVCIGDWGDLGSLCTYDKGTRGYEGRRYKKDLEAIHEAQDLFFAPIKAAKKKQPRYIMLEGNHEHRIERAISQDAAQLEGIISLDDLGYEDYGWEFIKYDGSTPGVIEVDGISYAHYHTSGVMNRAISGTYPAAALINKQYKSCTMGHSHVFDHTIRTDATGKHIHGLVCGVGTDQEMGYAGAANKLWWRGVVIKHDVEDGHYDIETVTLKRLKEIYG